jgi:hypothetical protein
MLFFLNKLIFTRDEHVEYINLKIIEALLETVFRIQIHRIRKFLGFPDLDP